MSVALNPPKKTTAGYYLALTHPVTSPSISWDSDDSWFVTLEWSSWANAVRADVIQELLKHPKWFSRPPRQEILEPLCSPWSGTNARGQLQAFCKLPDTPGPKSSTGSAKMNVDGLLMTATSITPVISIQSHTVDEKEDTISLYGDGETVVADDDDEETREIRLDDIEDAPPTLEPTRIRNREWDAHKFLAKERVRETRLKAQIAIRVARKEEERFYANYGDLEDNESHFSDYDLSDDESDATSASEM
jgi:hypothetical protein